jgi:hypothetical protein
MKLYVALTSYLAQCSIETKSVVLKPQVDTGYKQFTANRFTRLQFHACTSLGIAHLIFVFDENLIKIRGSPI